MSDWDVIEERLLALTLRVKELEDDLNAYKGWAVKALTGGLAFLLYQVARNIPAFAEYLK